MPVIEIGGNKVNNGMPGEVTRKIQELFQQAIERQCGELADKIN